MDRLDPEDLIVADLGPCRFDSPLEKQRQRWIDGSRRIRVDAEVDPAAAATDGLQPSFEPAGPRERIFFEPKQATCGVVTCGGLCPGVNDVLRSLVLTLHHGYGIGRILGFRYGYSGLRESAPAPPVELTPESVATIHEDGGTLLGASRGPQDVAAMVDRLEALGVDVLFVIGGDGTLRGGTALCEEIRRRGRPIGVIGVPKTIDNDIAWTQRSFGFATAVETARAAIAAAHVEAQGAWNGVGLVKLMGRHSGFIAAHATLASADVNFCLVPEVPFELDGPDGFLDALSRRLDSRHHAVVVVAEGAGQELLARERPEARDASGNVRLGDVGPFLLQAIRDRFSRDGTDATVKYIDPSYIIRSLPANAMDSEFCLVLGQHAAHAGMAGRTEMIVGFWGHRFTHVPIAVATGRRKQIDPDGPLWNRVLEATGQPAKMSPGS